jgi:hypothetical protein
VGDSQALRAWLSPTPYFVAAKADKNSIMTYFGSISLDHTRGRIWVMRERSWLRALSVIS